jgi:hypothetical protein
MKQAMVLIGLIITAIVLMGGHRNRPGGQARFSL